MMESLKLGPITIHLYGITFALAVLAGFFVARKRASFYKIKKEEVENLFLAGLFSGILFARLYHVLDYFSYYRKNLFEIFAIWQGGLGIFGGILGGVFGVWLYVKARKLDFLKACDLLAPSLALGQAIGRWGNFFNQEAFGPPTNFPWRIFISPENRPETWSQFQYFHPLFLYESILNFLNFLVLIYFARKLGQYGKGVVTALFFLNYGIIRFFVEFLRFDTAQIGGIKLAHILSIGFILAGLFALAKCGIIKRR